MPTLREQFKTVFTKPRQFITLKLYEQSKPEFTNNKKDRTSHQNFRNNLKQCSQNQYITIHQLFMKIKSEFSKQIQNITPTI